ncbi:hypothetical protein [Mucilaginibacter gossypii]|uniref:hypothetical protein n=1 Tax=Mucilaginibacter gossypii TaxID=551996 RepID=UPI00115F9CB9|nr:hypothetical protein [Mucilaginibacter gossypii]
MEEYTITIKVMTRTFDPVKNKTVEATGTMTFTGRETRSEPRVPYFPPICRITTFWILTGIAETRWHRAASCVTSG